MTKKDFFILLIKLFGLYSIVTAIFVSLPRNFSFVLMDFGFKTVIYFVLILAVIIALFVLLIFKSPYLVKILKLEKGFDDERLELGNLTSTEIVKIAVIIIGGFLIIDNIPVFLNQVFTAFYLNINSHQMSAMSNWGWIVSGLKILLGYLMITNLNFIVRILKLKDKKEG